MTISFDDLDEQAGAKSQASFFTLPLEDAAAGDKKSMELVHKWLVDEKNYLLGANRDRFTTIRKNLALNKGIMYQDQEVRGSPERENQDFKKRTVQKIVINILREMNRVRASRILKYKPAVAILPTNDELKDKVAAESCEKLISHIWYTQRFDGEKLPQVVDAKGPMGEAYLFVDWNPNLGDLHSSYKKALDAQKKNNEAEGAEQMEKVPLLNDSGVQEKNDKGEPIWVEKPVRNGDCEYRVKLALDVLVDRHPSRQFKNARYVFERDVMTVEEARLLYPDGAENITADRDASFFDYGKMESVKSENLVEVWKFWHRRHETIDKGSYIVFTSKGLISKPKDFPFSHRNLPCVRWTDLSNPGEQDGISFFEDVKGPSGAFNNITNMILRNEILVAHPKWMLPAGAADIKDLGNAITVVQFKGPNAPQLVQANPTGQGAYQLRDALKEEAFRMADVSRTGNGEPPKGVTAAVALQYLSELESERWNQPVLTHNEAVIQLVQMTLAVCGDYYDATDERMIRLQGNDGEWMSEFFDSAALAKDYDVRVQGSSALPETKAARTETLLFMAEKFPQQVDPEQVIDMLGLAQEKKFISEATVSLRAAEAENEMLLGGKDLEEPQNYEDQVVHWKTHVRKMREWSYKNRSPAEVKEKMKKHLMTHEMLMHEMALKDPQFAAIIGALPGFPLFFVPPALPAAPVDPAAAEAALPPMGAPDPSMDLPPELPVQQPGEDVAAVVPPVEEQLGLEDENLQPTNSI